MQPPGWSGPQTGPPAPGEVIRLRCNVRFPWGPASAIALSNVNGSNAQQPQPQQPPTHRDNQHLFLVLSISASGYAILVPIFAYSRSPIRSLPDDQWEADRWMRTQASVHQRRHHIPVPATIDGRPWEPLPHPSVDAPRVSFGAWTNSKPSWLIMKMVSVSFAVAQMPVWYRRRDSRIQVDDPSVLAPLQLYVRDILPLELSPPAPQDDPSGDNDLTVMRFVMPGSESFWMQLFGETGDGDSLDPVAFWNFPGAPEPLRKIAVEHARAEQSQRIVSWSEGVEVRCGRPEDDPEVDMSEDWAEGSGGDDDNEALVGRELSVGN